MYCRWRQGCLQFETEKHDRARHSSEHPSAPQTFEVLMVEQDLTILLERWLRVLQEDNARCNAIAKGQPAGAAARYYYYGSTMFRKSFRQLFTECGAFVSALERVFYVLSEVDGDDDTLALSKDYGDGFVELMGECATGTEDMHREIITSYINLCVKCRGLPSTRPEVLEDVVRKTCELIGVFVMGNGSTALDIFNRQFTLHGDSAERAKFLNNITNSKSVAQLAASNSDSKGGDVISSSTIATAVADVTSIGAYMESAHDAAVALAGMAPKIASVKDQVAAIGDLSRRVAVECEIASKDAESKIGEVQEAVEKLVRERYEKLKAILEEKQKLVMEGKHSPFYEVVEGAMEAGTADVEPPEDPYQAIQVKRLAVVKEYNTLLLDISRKVRAVTSKAAACDNIESVAQDFVALGEVCARLLERALKDKAVDVSEYLGDLEKQSKRCVEAHGDYVTKVTEYCKWRCNYLEGTVLPVVEEAQDLGCVVAGGSDVDHRGPIVEDIDTCRFFMDCLQQSSERVSGLRKAMSAALEAP